MAALDELMTSLRAEGSLDSEGRFTLDREQARSKMQRFALADARLYVLELVQAAILRGATSIRFDIDADDMRMHFDGTCFTAAELDDLYGALFSNGEGRRVESVRQLAVALNAAMAMDLSHIELHSGPTSLTIRPDQEDAIGALASPSARTTVHVRRRFRIGVVLDFFRNIAGRLDEEQYLRERCGYASIPIDLEGTVISTGLANLPGSLLEITFSGERFRGVIALVEAGRPVELRLVKAAVWVDTRQLPELGTHLVAVVEGDDLRKDVSQARIVSDGALEGIVRELRSARWRLWRQAMQAASERILPSAQVIAWARTQLLHHARFDELRVDPNAAALATLLGWRDCRDESGRVTLHELVARAHEAPPDFSRLPFPDLPRAGPPVVLLTDEHEIECLTRLFGKLVDRTHELEQAQAIEAARRAWLNRRGEPVLPPHTSFLDLAFIDQAGVRGQIGIDAALLADPEREPMARATFFKQGCLLGHGELDLDLPHVWLAVEADFQPNELHDDVVRDQRFADVLLTCIEALRDVMLEVYELATRGRHEPAVLGLTRRWLAPSQTAPVDREPAIRGLIKRWLALMLVADHRRAVLEKLGVPSNVASMHSSIGEALLESIAPERLRGDEIDPLAELPLFVDFADRRLSLADLARSYGREGRLHYLPWSTHIEPISALPGIARLGKTDRALLEAIFGAPALVPWLDELAAEQARTRHLAKPIVELEHARRDVLRRIAAQGGDPGSWVMPLPNREGFMALIPTTSEDDDLEPGDVSWCRVRVLHEGRRLTMLHRDLGFGPLLVMVEDPRLSPTSDFRDVVDDEHVVDLCETLRAVASALVEALCTSFVRLPAAMQRWLGKALLLRAASDGAHGNRTMLDRVRELPLLPTVDDAALSVSDAEALVERHGKLEVVDDEHPPATVDDPPILRVDWSAREALESLFGKAVLVEGESRIRLAGLQHDLERLPEIAAPVLDATTMLVSESYERPKVRGEIGLGRAGGRGGLRLQLCTAGRLVGVVEQDLHLPIEAIFFDDELPVTASAKVDEKHKRISVHRRNCRRRIPHLILLLAEAVRESLAEGSQRLTPEELHHASELLLRHAIDEQDRDESRSKTREAALKAVTTMPLFSDVWGDRHSIDDIRRLTRGQGVDVLERLRPSMPAGESATSLGRLILSVDALQRQCLERFCPVRVINGQWAQELEALRRLRDAPPIEVPDFDEVALAHRRAQVAGGLEAILWLPRSHDPLDRSAELTVAFAHGDRELARENVLPFLPCTGIVRSPGLRVAAGRPVLDERQRASLERQIVALYDGLVGRTLGQALAGDDRPRAAAYLAHADVELDDAREHPAVARLGKRIHKLRTKLSNPKVVSPALRLSLRRAEPMPTAEETGEDDDAIVSGGAPPLPEPAAVATTPAPATPPTPEQALLAELDAELHWARARHGSLLDELGLATMTIGEAPGQGVASLGPRGIVVRRDHPIVARLLQQQTFDPFDLAFVLVGVYALLNERHERIADDDERAFVHQLAETLVMAARRHG